MNVSGCSISLHFYYIFIQQVDLVAHVHVFFWGGEGFFLEIKVNIIILAVEPKLFLVECGEDGMLSNQYLN